MKKTIMNWLEVKLFCLPSSVLDSLNCRCSFSKFRWAFLLPKKLPEGEQFSPGKILSFKANTACYQPIWWAISKSPVGSWQVGIRVPSMGSVIQLDPNQLDPNQLDPNQLDL